MKKSEMAILSLLVLAAVFVFNGKINRVTNPCVQDYIAGQGNIKGNVNVEDYYERDERFAIGAGGRRVRRFQGSRQGFCRTARKLSGRYFAHSKGVSSARAFKAQLPLLSNLRLANHKRLGRGAPTCQIRQLLL